MKTNTTTKTIYIFNWGYSCRASTSFIYNIIKTKEYKVVVPNFFLYNDFKATSGFELSTSVTFASEFL